MYRILSYLIGKGDQLDSGSNWKEFDLKIISELVTKTENLDFVSIFSIRFSIWPGKENEKLIWERNRLLNPSVIVGN